MTSRAETISIGDLQSIELDADLTILYSECAKLPLGRKIHLVGGEPFSERGTLRLAFAAIQPNTNVEVVLHEAVAARISIEDSVEVDGVGARVKPATEWIDSEDDETLIDAGTLLDELNPVLDDITASSRPRDSIHKSESHAVFGLGGASMHGKSSPQLLEFTKIDVGTSHGDFLNLDPLGRAEATRSGLMEALLNIPRGHVITFLSDNVNPIQEVEMLSRLMRREFVIIDCANKLRLRPGQNEVAASFLEAMSRGRWYVVLNGHKSINTLRVLDQLINDAHGNGCVHFHPTSRIIIATDPHPHFPHGLLEKGITMKLRQNYKTSGGLESTMQTSVSRRKVLGAAGSMSAMSMNKSQSPFNSASSNPNIVTASGVAGGKKKRAKVRISAAVEVVEIPSRDVMCSAVSKPSGPITGSIVKEKEFTGLEGDKFLCIASCGKDSDRVAVGSSLGNVYFLDGQGQAVSSMHAHDACVWDIDSQSASGFVTGSEDCSTIRWSAGSDGVAQQNQVAKCGHDIFAVTYYNEDPSSPIFLGGLMSVVVALSPKGQAQQIPAPSSTQALCSLPNKGKIIGGGGDGSVMIIDAETCTMDSILNSHKKKVPCVAHNENIIISGSFDCSIKLWDVNNLQEGNPVHTLKLKNYVTGVGVDGNILAASVGENLYLWDLRNVSEVLGGFPQAWSGLSRGLVVNSQTRQVVTASPDGVVRLWRYQ